jgi:hypothetical protein
MSKKVAIVQSNYIPWRGYFDLINSVDEFILYDDMQYTIRDWRNRNLIKTASGPLWLTIPVEVKGKYFQKIKDVTVSDPQWARKHWASIIHSYSKARHFSASKELFAGLYSQADERSLSKINYRFIGAICQLLGINTTISWSMDYELHGDKTEKLVNLCKQAGGTHYLSGPAAKTYLVEEPFAQEGISVSYMDYSGYPDYNQLYPPFEPGVSVLDLIFNEGPEATRYMKTFCP